MLPIFLNIDDRLAVVIGGGPVGRRKAAALIAAGARVRLIALETRPQGEQSDRLNWVQEPFRSEHLDGAALVFACGPAELNLQVVAQAHARGLWCNSADPPAAGDFFLPASIHRGDLVVAVSTGGAAPALAKKIRQRLEGTFDDAFATWVDLLAELRPLVLAQIADPHRRQRVLRNLTRWHWLRRVRRDGCDAVRQTLYERIRGLADHPPGPV